MSDKNFVVVESKALPEVFLKVLEAKRLMESGKCKTVQESACAVGISRGAFYKYRDSVFDLHEGRGRSVTVGMSLEDTPGLLSNVLSMIAERGANILTINQTIPINRLAFLTLTMEMRDSGELMEALAELPGVSGLKVLALGAAGASDGRAGPPEGGLDPEGPAIQ
jgi:chorismate mutase